ncbi:proline-rich protein 29-like [Protopterus annectens]|uniref:proline-rich protein 29-like n=1 Tax=Protopterus annectens TaxID=7888 RepID=UPI001CF94E3C|nr:proline-rich protein 29-like [Protopterus annectens]
MSFPLSAGNSLYADYPWKLNSSGVQMIPYMVPQQPTVFQQFQTPVSAVFQPTSFRAGHIKEDLVELMMIQNAQMHQVIMNNMTMSALSQFGHSAEPQTKEVNSVPVIIEKTGPDIVYHHYYDPYPYQVPPLWQIPPVQLLPKQVVRHLNDGNPVVRRELNAVPPPPPPSATGTVGADVRPASEYYGIASARM